MNRIATIVKGYPRLSETFIAQEILGLEKRGIAQLIVSLRHPTEGKVHDLNREIAADVLYLPEYLKDDPARVARRAGDGRRRSRASRAPEGVPRRPEARRLGQPPPPLRPGLRARARASRRHRLDPHALSPHARLRRALRGADPRARLVVLRARQGHLDDAEMGAEGEARRRRMGRHLHAREPRLSALALPLPRGRSTSSITASTSRAFPPAPKRDGARRRHIHHRLGRPRGGEEGLFRSSARARRAPRRTLALRACRRRPAREAAQGGGRAAQASPTASPGTAPGPRLHLRHAEARRPLRAPLAARPLRRPRRAAERADGGAGLRRAGRRDRRFRHSGAGDARQDRLARQGARPEGARGSDPAR